MPSSETLPKLPRSICMAIAKVHEPLLGRTAICPTMQGQMKSQLQVSKYWPLMFQDDVAINYLARLGIIRKPGRGVLPLWMLGVSTQVWHLQLRQRLVVDHFVFT